MTEPAPCSAVQVLQICRVCRSKIHRLYPNDDLAYLAGTEVYSAIISIEIIDEHCKYLSYAQSKYIHVYMLSGKARACSIAAASATKQPYLPLDA